MVCWADFSAAVQGPTREAELSESRRVFRYELMEPSDASTRSVSPGASSATSDENLSRSAASGSKAQQACNSPVTLADLGLDLITAVGQPAAVRSTLPRQSAPQSQTARSILPAATVPPAAAPKASPCILGSFPKQRSRPATIAVPGDASDRTPLGTPAAELATPQRLGFGFGTMATPSSRPPRLACAPHTDASQRSPAGWQATVAPHPDVNIMATSPSKRRQLPVATGDASQRSPTAATPVLAAASPQMSFLGTAGMPVVAGDASRRSPTMASASEKPTSAPSAPSTPSPKGCVLGTKPRDASLRSPTMASSWPSLAVSPKSCGSVDPELLSWIPSPQRRPQPQRPEQHAAPPSDILRRYLFDAGGRQLSGRELEAQLCAAAPENYED
ncbi:unnamed protein product [Polarella glacialis]|uniref:Uncharacterized protein n=1 Tax=Polarella glacialis TaxID=89957 RepID=A0A813KHT7_POLGL|nr:unnamed protein product [Polarella glacialis]